MMGRKALWISHGLTRLGVGPHSQSGGRPCHSELLVLEFFVRREDRWIQLWGSARVMVLVHLTHNTN